MTLWAFGLEATYGDIITEPQGPVNKHMNTYPSQSAVVPDQYVIFTNDRRLGSHPISHGKVITCLLSEKIC